MTDILHPRCVYIGIRDVAMAIPRVSDIGLGIEIVFNDTSDLWPRVKWDTLLGLSDDLAEAQLPVACHGPFNSIAIASKDDHIAEYSYQCLAASIEGARILGSPLIVFHTGYLPQYPTTYRPVWLDKFCVKLNQLLDIASNNGIVLAMENTYELDTTLFEEIFERVQHPFLGMCFDTGHSACFSKVPAKSWIDSFSEQIVHLHLSDNDGESDLHWGLGRGVVNISTLIGPLIARGARPSVTFEVPLDETQSSNDYLTRSIAAAIGSTHEK
ncbi:sugar phosphate isomerase/epimerase [bacterium]|nr:sugar phosphate isomerase/epimerase [bacterium]